MTRGKGWSMKYVATLTTGDRLTLVLSGRVSFKQNILEIGDQRWLLDQVGIMVNMRHVAAFTPDDGTVTAHAFALDPGEVAELPARVRDGHAVMWNRVGLSDRYNSVDQPRSHTLAEIEWEYNGWTAVE